MKKRKVAIIIRDGWGYRKSCEDNAICNASTPVTDRIMEKFPNVLINAAGNAVGLPEGYEGNSEVGHMTIGSGRIILQSLARINKSIEDGSFFNIEELNQAIDNCVEHDSKLHIMGLLQTEGVHSHFDHLNGILSLCKQRGFHNVKLHIFTDGRDSPVTRSLEHIKNLKERLDEIGFGDISTVSGRYFAMDRDKRWERTRKAYEAIVHGIAKEHFSDVTEAVKKCHKRDETDEFIVPQVKEDYTGINDKDSVIFFNFRTDRTRQLTKAIVEKDFHGWETKPLGVFFVAMTQYYDPMNAHVAFKEVHFNNILGDVVSKKGMKQLRISETEKYAHVTFFFNDQVEVPFSGEERILVPSPKVSTYDKKPEMSVYEVADKLESEMKKDYDFIVCNLVNGDMVGHTGDVNAIEKAVTAVDSVLGDIVHVGLLQGYDFLIFADHGNAEDQTPEWRTSHTLNPVPFILVSNDLKDVKLKENRGLQDIAPTVLHLMGIEKPKEMTGESIIEKI